MSCPCFYKNIKHVFSVTAISFPLNPAGPVKELKNERMSHIRLPEPRRCVSRKITQLPRDQKPGDLGRGRSHVRGDCAWKTSQH